MTDNDGARVCCETSAEVNPPSAVELSLFEATTRDAAVTLVWRTTLEQSNDHFDVERAPESTGEFDRINPEQIDARAGGTPGEYSFVDRSASPGSTYDYRLVAVDIRGREQRFGPIQVTVARAVPKQLALGQNRPNPFNPSTTITFALPEAMPVALRVYDAQGHLVRTLADGVFSADFHAVAWDGRDDLGQPMGSGVYLYRLETGTTTIQNKMVLTK